MWSTIFHVFGQSGHHRKVLDTSEIFRLPLAPYLGESLLVNMVHHYYLIIIGRWRPARAAKEEH